MKNPLLNASLRNEVLRIPELLPGKGILKKGKLCSLATNNCGNVTSPDLCDEIHLPRLGEDTLVGVWSAKNPTKSTWIPNPKTCFLQLRLTNCIFEQCNPSPLLQTHLQLLTNTCFLMQRSYKILKVEEVSQNHCVWGSSCHMKIAA